MGMIQVPTYSTINVDVSLHIVHRKSRVMAAHIELARSLAQPLARIRSTGFINWFSL